MTDSYYIRDYQKLSFGGREYDATGVLGRKYDEFRSARKKFCRNDDNYKSMKAERERIIKDLRLLRDRYSAISRNENPAELKELCESLEEKKRLSRELQAFDAASQRGLKKLERASDRASEKLSRIAEGDARYSACYNEAVRAKMDYEMAAETYNNERDKIAAVLKTVADKANALETLKATNLRETSDTISSLEKRKDEIDDYFKMVQESVFASYYDTASRAAKLIEADPAISKDTANAIYALYPNYSRSEWYFDFNGGDKRGFQGGSSFGLISMCIKDNPKQSIAELITSVACYKSTNFCDAMEVITDLRDKGALFTYARHLDGSVSMVPWH